MSKPKDDDDGSTRFCWNGVLAITEGDFPELSRNGRRVLRGLFQIAYRTAKSHFGFIDSRTTCFAPTVVEIARAADTSDYRAGLGRAEIDRKGFIICGRSSDGHHPPPIMFTPELVRRVEMHEVVPRKDDRCRQLRDDPYDDDAQPNLDDLTSYPKV